MRSEEKKENMRHNVTKAQRHKEKEAQRKDIVEVFTTFLSDNSWQQEKKIAHHGFRIISCKQRNVLYFTARL